MRVTTYRVLGEFSKGVRGSVTINFSRSASSNCDDGCELKNAGCYAEVLERRPDRTELAGKLSRHESLGAELVCGRALYELSLLVSSGKRVPWVRISSAGSVPQPEDVTPAFRWRFRELLAFCKRASIPVHFPVETEAKARFYRELVGELATVRESAGTGTMQFLRSAGPTSAVAGELGTGYRERIRAARQLAQARRHAAPERKTIVCPAVVSGFNKKMRGAPWSPNAKCGNCTACSDSAVDVVYPIH